MLTNVLTIKLKDKSPENIEAAQNLLLSMVGNIEYLADLSIKTDIRRGAKSYDFMMIAKYNSMEDFNAYVSHPLHVEVGTKINEMAEHIATVFYEE